MSAVMTKGATLVNLHDFVHERFGPDGFARLCAALPEQAVKMVGSPNATEWYPFADYEQVLRACGEVLFEGAHEKLDQFGAYNLQKSIRGVYKIIVRVLSPETLIQKSARLWSTFLTESRLEVERLDKNRLRLTVTGLAPTHAVWCHGLRGSFLGSLQACGVDEAAVVHDACVLGGAPACTFLASWR